MIRVSSGDNGGAVRIPHLNLLMGGATLPGPKPDRSG
ncbi:MAG: hypothetical protein BWX84_00637 [Verrucomicrobia bacterium ADurb.Bin118]|nr:MAG: hypothetical protein BWX84_00637 [Verrucomicrobia bacterium ADurb.Bin118]